MILHHRLMAYLTSIGALALALSTIPAALDQHDLQLTTKLAFADDGGHGGGGVGDAAAGQSNGHLSPGIAAAYQADDQGTSSAAIVQGLVGDNNDQNTVDLRSAGAMADELARKKAMRQDAARAYADE